MSVKLPTFWPDMPEVWFAQAEANFRARRITSQKSKFNLVVVALDADTLKGVLDLIEQEPDEQSYDRLKARLVQAYKLSTVDKVKQCMELPPLADENPIKLADQMIALTWEASAEDIVKMMFLLKLPDSVRKAMWAEPLKDWSEMKARAKGLPEKTKCTKCLAHAASTETTKLRRMPSDLSRKVNQIKILKSSKSLQVLSTSDQMARACSTSSTDNLQPGAVHHAVRRETGKPGVSSVNRGRLTNPT